MTEEIKENIYFEEVPVLVYVGTPVARYSCGSELSWVNSFIILLTQLLSRYSDDKYDEALGIA